MAGYVATGYWVAEYGDLAGTTAVAGGGYDKDKPKRKKYFVELNGKLMQFGTRQAAMNALSELQDNEPVEIEELEVAAETGVAAKPSPAPEQVIALPSLQAFAEASGQLAAYQAAYRSRHFAALLALFQRQQDDIEQQLDEEDVEMLLLSL
jgi:hypothetical protein